MTRQNKDVKVSPRSPQSSSLELQEGFRAEKVAQTDKTSRRPDRCAMVEEKPPPRVCPCGSEISGTDTHTRCAACLRLRHTQESLTSPDFCEHCARLSLKSLRRRLARQASLSDQDPLLGTTPSSATAGAEDSEVPASTSWADQLDVAESLMDVFSGLTAIQRISAVVDNESDLLDESEGLFSEEEDCDESTFIPSAQATQPNGRQRCRLTAPQRGSAGRVQTCSRAVGHSVAQHLGRNYQLPL
ncbi:hypothetical protein MHYP_G00172990 [Metynnis hypsauchen]